MSRRVAQGSETKNRGSNCRRVPSAGAAIITSTPRIYDPEATLFSIRANRRSFHVSGTSTGPLLPSRHRKSWQNRYFVGLALVNDRPATEPFLFQPAAFGNNDDPDEPNVLTRAGLKKEAGEVLASRAAATGPHG